MCPVYFRSKSYLCQTSRTSESFLLWAAFVIHSFVNPTAHIPVVAFIVARGQKVKPCQSRNILAFTSHVSDETLFYRRHFLFNSLQRQSRNDKVVQKSKVPRLHVDSVWLMAAQRYWPPRFTGASKRERAGRPWGDVNTVVSSVTLWGVLGNLFSFKAVVRSWGCLFSQSFLQDNNTTICYLLRSLAHDSVVSVCEFTEALSPYEWNL